MATVTAPCQIDKAFIEAWRKAWVPVERLSITDWAKRYVTLPPSLAIQGSFDVTRSKYMQAVFEALQDDSVRVVVIMASVQSGKSLISQVFIPWIIANAPSNILLLFQSHDIAKEEAATRIMPILESCPPVQRLLPTDRFDKNRTRIIFPNKTALTIASATENQLQTRSVRYCIGDECYLWEHGFIEQFILRASAFPTNSKILLVSTAGEEDDEFTTKFNEGTQEEYCWHCPACQHLQPYELTSRRDDGTYAGLNGFDEAKLENGKYDFNKLETVLRLSCFNCKHDLRDTPPTRRLLNDTAAYKILNPTAQTSIRSFHWNAFAPIDTPWADIAIKYLKAKYKDESAGDRAPLKEFQQKILARPWNQNLVTIQTKAALAEYDVNAAWADEAHRFLTVDVQADCFWVVIRAWAKSGESRLLWCGRLETWEQVREKQLEFKVRDQKTFVDCGHEPQTVFKNCVKNGHWAQIGKEKKYLCWNALKGSGTESFTITGAKGEKLKSIVSARFEANPGLGQYATGQRCDVYHFASDAASTILWNHYTGKAAKFLSPKDDPIYVAHMNAETRRKFTDEKTGKTVWRWVRIGQRENHIRDDEKMQIVAAALVGVLGGVQASEPEPEEKPVTPDAAPSHTDTL